MSEAYSTHGNNILDIEVEEDVVNNKVLGKRFNHSEGVSSTENWRVNVRCRSLVVECWNEQLLLNDIRADVRPSP
jgi:hypothetical protein